MAPPSKIKVPSGTQQQSPTCALSYPGKKTMNAGSTATMQTPVEIPSSLKQPSDFHEDLHTIKRNFGGLRIAGNKSQPERPTELTEHNMLRSTELIEDDRSHLSNSSTKPASFDTKSMASVTTFAMDEKESLRPDDSASVQAVEEDKHLSPPNSETGGPVIRVQLRHGTNEAGLPVRRSTAAPLANLPRFGDLPLQPFPPTELSSQVTQTLPSPIADHALPDGRALLLAPDEKLLAAMATPKDRLFLLQLEEKIVTFITESRYATFVRKDYATH